MVLQNHVKDSAAYLRIKKDSAASVFADWTKWVGFAFLGFAVQQWINVSHQKIIVQGSVSLLVLDAVVAAVLIVAGFKIDKPLGHVFNMIHRKRNRGLI